MSEYKTFELPVVEQNHITLFNRYSLWMCVILSNSKLENWLFHNFNNVISSRTGNEYFPNYMEDLYRFHDELFCRQIMSFDCIKEQNTMDLIITKLNQQYYCMIEVDEYFLPFSDSFQKRNFVHPLLIYGYRAINSVTKSRKLSVLKLPLALQRQQYRIKQE